MSTPLAAPATAPVGTPARALIDIDGVTKVYQTAGGPVESLRPLTFQIADGEFMAIVGPSGCGKSTLLKMVAGLLPVTEGSIRLGGKRVEGPPDDVGIVFQSPVLLAWRSVLENVMLQIDMRHLGRKAYLPKARALLELVGLTGFEQRYPWELSGGMQQRASLCRALIHEPQLLMLDEPFGALDSFTREELWCVMRDLHAGRPVTIILVTHDLREAAFLADRIFCMSSRPGRIIAERQVKFARPRDLDITYTGEFTDLVHDLRSQIAGARQAS